MTHNCLTFGSRHVQMRPVMPDVWLFNLPEASVRSQFHVSCQLRIFLPLLFLILTGTLQSTKFSWVNKCPHIFILAGGAKLNNDLEKVKNEKRSPLIHRNDLLFKDNSPSWAYPQSLSATGHAVVWKKDAYLESTGIKMSNAGGGGDTSAQVFHFSRRALWTLSTQSGQRVASITVTVPATCNVGNNNSFKTLQWGVTALCRTWESHLWQAPENLFWTQSLQRAICFDSSTC